MQKLSPSEEKILEWLYQNATDDKTVEIDRIPDVADAVGVSVSTVYNSMRLLQSRGMIHLEYKKAGTKNASAKIELFPPGENDHLLERFSEISNDMQLLVPGFKQMMDDYLKQIRDLNKKLDEKEKDIQELKDDLAKFNKIKDFLLLKEEGDNGDASG